MYSFNMNIDIREKRISELTDKSNENIPNAAYKDNYLQNKAITISTYISFMLAAITNY